MLYPFCFICCLLQALRAVAHNYPNIMAVCWDQVSCIVFRFLSLTSPQVAVWPSTSNAGHSVSAIEEKVITAAIKVTCAQPNMKS